MERRSDKYANKMTNSRVLKNSHLYDEVSNKISYEEITPDFVSKTEVDLSSLNLNRPKREDYQKIKEYKEILPSQETPKKEETIKEELAPKTFDIKKVLEEAKKNRVINDDSEKKRKLDEEAYSILASLNKKYLNNDDKNSDDTSSDDLTLDESDELRELINTITSKTLVSDEEEKELLSELLATTIDVKLESELSKDDIDKLYDLNKEKDKSLKDDKEDEEEIDNTFYTHSMELSKKDLLSSYEDDDEDEEEGSKSTLKIILLVVLLIIILLMISYFILKYFGIAFN